jgi:hypothetical protein
MESRRTPVTVPVVADTRLRFFRRALPVTLVGIAVGGVALVGNGGIGRAHYLRQLMFGPAGPGAEAPRSAPAPAPLHAPVQAIVQTTGTTAGATTGLPTIPAPAARAAHRPITPR